jgi:hypothetical protein
MFGGRVPGSHYKVSNCAQPVASEQADKHSRYHRKAGMLPALGRLALSKAVKDETEAAGKRKSWQ